MYCKYYMYVFCTLSCSYQGCLFDYFLRLPPTTYHLPPTTKATFCKYHRPPYHHGGSGSGGSAALKFNLASLKFSRPILHSAFIVIIIANTRFYCFNRVIVHRIDVKRSRFSSNKAFFFRNFIGFFQKALGVLCLRTHIYTSEGKLSSNMRRLSANGIVWWIRVSRIAPTSISKYLGILRKRI